MKILGPLGFTMVGAITGAVIASGFQEPLNLNTQWFMHRTNSPHSPVASAVVPHVLGRLYGASSYGLEYSEAIVHS